MTRWARSLSLFVAVNGIGLFVASWTSFGADQPANDVKSTVDAEEKPIGKQKETDPKASPNAKVTKTEEEWRKLLTRDQFLVTRMKATEPPFSGKYSRGHFQGVFQCVCCKADLFDSRTKFESGTGWPSFWRPFSKTAISSQWDNSEAEARVEVMCARCDAHLGHVFDDGPAPTGLRYCINSLAITLKPPDKSTSEGSTKTGKKTSRAKK